MTRVRKTSVEVEQAARRLRREMTPAETALWNVLRAWRVYGVKFRRQHPVGRFVLDFYCPSHRLCIEVDGGIHDTQQDRDEARDETLAAAGIGVLRFRNEQVLGDLPSVIQTIRRVLNAGDA